MAYRIFGLANERVADIWSKCTDFPRAGRTSYGGTVPIHAGSIELLEVDANTTLSGGSYHNMSIYGGQSVGNNSTMTGVNLPNVVAPAPWPT